MSKGLDIAYAIKRKAKKMSDGGSVEKSVWSDLESKVREGFGDKPRPENQESQADKYEKIRAQNKANMGYAHGGSVMGSPESLVSRIRKAMRDHDHKKMSEGGEVENEDHIDFDPLDDDKPQGFTDGGPVLPGADEAQASLRKAFKFSEGGDVEEDPKKSRMKHIMMSLMRDKKY